MKITKLNRIKARTYHDFSWPSDLPEFADYNLIYGWNGTGKTTLADILRMVEKRGGIPPKTKGDFAFISHMLETAKRHSGRVAVIVPHGVLFRGAAEGQIRQKLIDENLLDAVIGLPANLFTSTGIPVAILVFDRSREQGGKNEKRKDVVFIDASKEFRSGKAQNHIDEEHINKIVKTYLARKTVEKYSYVANLDEIRENDYNLNIPRYVDTFEEEAEIDVQTLQKEIKQIETELAQVRGKMDGYLKELGINV